MKHISVCIERHGKREAFIVSADTDTQAERYAEMISPRIGYCGNNNFQEAVKRCSLMEHDLPGGWGVIGNEAFSVRAAAEERG